MTDPIESLRSIVERRRRSAALPDDHRELLGALALVEQRRDGSALPWVIELWCSRPTSAGVLDRLVEIGADLRAWETDAAMGEAIAASGSFARFAAAFDEDLLRDEAGSAYAHAILSAFSFAVSRARDADLQPGASDVLARGEWIRLLTELRDREDLGDAARRALALVPSAVVPQVPRARSAARARARGDALSRYLAGEHEAAWQSLCDLGRLDSDARQEARAVAAEIMKTVRLDAEIVVEVLSAAGYPFVREPLAAPESNREPLAQLAVQIGGHPPVSLEVFWEVVGGIDFCRAEDETVCELDVDLDDFLISNAICVNSIANALWCIEDWRNKRMISDYVDVAISPDELHKEWTSGGAPYAIRIPSMHADGRVLGEPHRIDFVPYLRRNFEHCGFLGYEFQLGSAPYRRLVERVKHRLMPF